MEQPTATRSEPAREPQCSACVHTKRQELRTVLLVAVVLHAASSGRGGGSRHGGGRTGEEGGSAPQSVRMMRVSHRAPCLFSLAPALCCLLLLLLLLSFGSPPADPTAAAAAKHATQQQQHSTQTHRGKGQTHTYEQEKREESRDGAASSRCAVPLCPSRAVASFTRVPSLADCRSPPSEGPHRASRPNGLPTTHTLPIGVLHGL